MSYERWFILLLWKEEWLVGATPSAWNFGSSGPRWSEIVDFQPIFACSSSAVTLSGRGIINTNGKFTTQFTMSLRWSLYIAPKSPKGVSKRQNSRISPEIALRLKKVCYKVSLCENCQQRSCKTFIDLTNRAKMVEILGQVAPVGAKSPIFNRYSPVAPQP